MALDLMTADHLGKQGGSFEPQRANNGRLIITGLPGESNGDILILSLSSFTLPKAASNILEVAYLNERRKFAGTTTYDDLSVVYKDHIDVGTAKQLWAWRRQVSDPTTGKIGLAANYKKQGLIELYGPNGSNSKTDRTIKLQGCWISAMDPGDIDFQNDETMNISCTITIDKFFPVYAGIDDQPGTSSAPATSRIA